MAAGSWDQYMDFHIGFAVDDLAPFVERFQDSGTPFFAREAVGSGTSLGSLYSLFVQVPGANSMLVELSSAVPPPDSVDVQPWSLCDDLDEGAAAPAAVGVMRGEHRVHDALRARRGRRERSMAGNDDNTLPVMWPLHML